MTHVGKKFKLRSGSGGTFVVVKECKNGEVIGRNSKYEARVRINEVVFKR